MNKKSIHTALVLLISVIVCGSINNAKAASSSLKGVSISNATKSAMPIARKQKVGSGVTAYYIYTAKAKSGFCFAVKGKKIVYMRKESATKYGAKQFSMSHTARAAARKAVK